MANNRFYIRLYGNGNINGLLAKLFSSRVKVGSLSVADGEAVFWTDRAGIILIRKYRRTYRVKARIQKGTNTRKGKGFLAGHRYSVALLIPFICSLFLWSVTVESEMPEVEELVQTVLNEKKIVPLRPLATVPDEAEIRQFIMDADTNLSWVRFKRSGGTLTVIPMVAPSLLTEEREGGPPSDLIARTGGIVTRYDLRSGERFARLHATVKKGDLLAKGTVTAGDKIIIIGAEGAVFADYWMEYSFVVPRSVSYKVQGEETMKVTVNNPFSRITNGRDLLENLSRIKDIVVTERLIGVEQKELLLEEGMEETVLIPLLKRKLMDELSPGAVIKEENLLHASFDNDKVSGTILFLINENIAVKRPIYQGD